MAALLNRNGWYYAQFFDQTRTPKRKQIPLRTRTRKTALKLLRSLEDEVAEGKRDPWDDAPSAEGPPAKAPIQTLGDAVEAFLATRAHLRSATRESYRVRLGLFVRHAGAHTPVSHLQSAHVDRFLSETAVRDVTRSGYLRHLRVFARWTLRAGVLPADITGGIALRRVPERAPRFLSPRELEGLLGVVRQHRQDRWLLHVIECAAYLGLRLGEVCALTWKSVDLERGRLTVSNTDEFTSKSGKERTIPVPARALSILLERHRERTEGGPGYVFTSSRGGRINRHFLSRRFCRYRRLAGLPDGITFHSLRHTAASWLMIEGASIEAIRLYLGHSSVTVTQKYAHLSEQAYFAQINAALDGVRRGAPRTGSTGAPGGFSLRPGVRSLALERVGPAPNEGPCGDGVARGLPVLPKLPLLPPPHGSHEPGAEDPH